MFVDMVTYSRAGRMIAKSNTPTKPKEGTDLDNFTQGIDAFTATPATDIAAQEKPQSTQQSLYGALSRN